MTGDRLAERGIPVHVGTDRTLRVKIIDACGMTCTFCHNEGSPVAQDNRKRLPLAFTSSGPSGRVSIYAESSGVSFLAAPVHPDDGYVHAIASLRDALGVRELHLTGGEPTLHPRLPELIRLAAEAGFSVRMTSNGENGAAQMGACAAAGLEKINFSIFGTTAAELAEVQNSRYANPKRAARKIDALKASIAEAGEHGVQAAANIVVPGRTHIARVHRLLDEWSPKLSVRLLNSLAAGRESIDAITEALAERNAAPEARYVTAGVSGSRTAYRLPDGRRVYFKEIRRVRLPQTCAGCRFGNGTDCEEGFYGVRLYRDTAGNYQAGVCIQRMDLARPLDEFLRSGLPAEILSLRASDREQLTRSENAR